jgi:hypothetical protein
MALAPPPSSAAPAPYHQAQRLCEKSGSVFFDSSTFPDDLWLCARGGASSFDAGTAARAERICGRDGGTFFAGFDGQLNYLGCSRETD